MCYACGYKGHIKMMKVVLPRKKRCNKFKNIGHFKKMCQTKVPPKHNNRLEN